LYRFLRFLLGLTARLPLPLLHGVGTLLGWTIYGISPTYRRHLRENLAQAGLAPEEMRRVRRAAIASAGRMIAEIPALWFRPHDQVATLVKEVEGADAAYAARDRGKTVVFLTPHMGCFEITAQYAARQTPLTVLYRAPKIGILEPLMREGRERPNVRLATADLGGVRELYAALKRGEPLGFLPDQVPGKGEGEWAEFFGRPAYTMTLAARIATRPEVACFLAYGRRLERGAGYAIVIRPLAEPLPGESPTRRVNRAIEALVRECPGQYLWGYNRYKVPRGATLGAGGKIPPAPPGVPA
jgi:Kdo2-lipid IVA lauroyltransferase/acyltransferase